MAAKKTTAKKATKKAAAKPAGEFAAKEAKAPKAPKAAKTAKTIEQMPEPAAVAAPLDKVKQKPASKPAVRISVDAVARAAYLNYRRRVEQGLPGDSNTDWLEAERQVAGEA